MHFHRSTRALHAPSDKIFFDFVNPASYDCHEQSSPYLKLQKLQKLQKSKVSMSKPQPQPGILKITPYVPGESSIPGQKKIIKLSSNETPLGPSPKALEAFNNAASELSLYPDGSATSLRAAIGARFGLDPERIVCGAGSDDLLNLLAAAYLGPGDEAIYTTHGFLVYRIVILAHGATPVIAQEKNLTANADAILSLVTERTKAVFIANPNNPTGTYMNAGEVKRLRAQLPEETLLILDGAYAEYVTKDDYDPGIGLVDAASNTVMTRTFSKIHGLASLRIGWAYCPEETADILNRIRGPFNLSGPASAAGIKAIEDVDHVDRAVQHNSQWRPWLETEINKLGLDVTPSVANFILINFPENSIISAEAADAYLKSKGVIVRRVAGYGLPNSLRMTVGTEEANRLTVSLLGEFLADIEKAPEA